MRHTTLLGTINGTNGIEAVYLEQTMLNDQVAIAERLFAAHSKCVYYNNMEVEA